MTLVYCFINGVPDRCLPAADRGLAYGHGVFETLRLCDGRFPLWDQHLRRLAEGARRLHIGLDVALLDHCVATSLAEFPASGVVKIILTAGVGTRGYRHLATASPNLLIQYFELPIVASEVVLQPCGYRLPDNPGLAGIKHLNRLDQVLAASELTADCDGLLLDNNDRVIEALSSNVFVRRGERWLTPDLSRSGVAGVMRNHLLSHVLPGLDLPSAVADIGLDEVASADEVLICNAISGIRPVAAIRGVGHWERGAGVQMLRQELVRQLPCFAA